MNAPASLFVVPGFADTARSWHRLLTSRLAGRHQVEIIDLPGVGLPPPPAPGGFDAMVDRVTDRIAEAARHPHVLAIGHSLGAAIAVTASDRLASRLTGLLSVEGNLTSDDGYFSAAAADHPDPETFLGWLIERVHGLVERGAAPHSYLESVNAADPATLWQLGRDAARRGAGDAFGNAFRALRIPTRYLWSAGSTPARTQHYLAEHVVDHRRNDASTHWPLERTPVWLIAEIDAFIQDSQTPVTAT